MEILTGEQMRAVDRHAIDTLGIPSILLMEAAGEGVARALGRDLPSHVARGVLILCGKGNNGGDGLAAARHLARTGHVPRVVLLCRKGEIQGDAALQCRAAIASGIEVREVWDAASWSAVVPLLERHGVVLDALLGTGAHGGARGLVQTAVEALNASTAYVVSLDLPSGLDADTHSVVGSAVRAARTYTLCRPKLCLVAAPAAEHSGTWSVIPIGIPDASVAASAPELEWLDCASVRKLLPPRQADAHKGSFGHLLAVAGSRDKSGAAVLLARAALRTGAGLVTLATPGSARSFVALQQAEIMTEALPETAEGTLDAAAVPRIAKLSAGKDSLALGPGLGDEDATLCVALAVALARTLPTVVDADGLNALASSGENAKLRGGAPLVLTPHPGEASRLLREDVRTIQEDRLEAARRLARETGAVVVLKGHRTVVAAPDRQASINSTGNPGMATAGAGDVLTGVIGALLARGLSARDAARLGVYVHGDAGDRAAALRGQDGMLAGDLVERLPQALRALHEPLGFRPW